jgi:hypothetical protein
MAPANDSEEDDHANAVIEQRLSGDLCLEAGRGIQFAE